MTKAYFAIAATFALALAGAASAQDLAPLHARPLDLGAVSGVAYYTVEENGYRVVATLGARESDAAPVRVDVTLAPGQKLVLSSPGAVGTRPDTVEIAREADLLVVRKPSATFTN